MGFDAFAPAFPTGLAAARRGVHHRWVRHVRLATQTRRRRPVPPPPTTVERLRDDTPAVVNMLANDATVTAAAFRATMIDLAARGWLRILPPDDDDELARVRPAAQAYHGDSLRPHERLVLQHVMARFTTDRAIPARYLAVDIRGSWWRRFAGLVAAEARDTGLVTRRWRPADLAAPAAFAGLAARCAGCSVCAPGHRRRGDRFGRTTHRCVDPAGRARGPVASAWSRVLVAPLVHAHQRGRRGQHSAGSRCADVSTAAGFGDLAPSAAGDRRSTTRLRHGHVSSPRVPRSSCHSHARITSGRGVPWVVAPGSCG